MTGKGLSSLGDLIRVYIFYQIFWGSLMHAKYMRELYSLLMHIPTYYNVIRFYNHDLQ
jgi:nicotinamide riboside transporter PnuC